MFQKLRTVVYHVNNLAAAKAWYEQASGVKPYFDEPFYVGFDINGFELGLDPDGTHHTPGNNATAYWAVENAQAVVDKLVSIGAKLIQAPNNVGGTIVVATVEDPFGNYVGLIEGA